MNAPVRVEPPRYGQTGIGIGCYAVRSEFHGDAMAYALDAPAFIPRGSQRCRLVTADRFNPEPYHYVSHTELRA